MGRVGPLLLCSVLSACSTAHSPPVGASDGGAGAASTGAGEGGAGVGGGGTNGGPGFVAAVVADRSTVCPGDCVDFEARVTGGVQPYSFTWGHPAVGPGPHRVCPTVSTTVGVVVRDSSSTTEFHERNPDVRAELRVVVGPNCADGGAAMPDGGVAMPDGGVTTPVERCTLTAEGRSFYLLPHHAQRRLAVNSRGDGILLINFQDAVSYPDRQFGGSLRDQGLIVAVDAQCQIAWSKLVGDTEGVTVWLNGVAVDAQDNVIVAGEFYGTLDLGAGPMLPRDRMRGFILKLDPTGRYLWSRTIESLSVNASALGVTVGADGRITFAATAGADTNMGVGPLGLFSLTPIPMIGQLTADGITRWTKTFGPVYLDFNVTADEDNRIWVAGWTARSVNLGGAAVELGENGNGRGYLGVLDPLGTQVWLRPVHASTAQLDWKWWSGVVAVGQGPMAVVSRDAPEDVSDGAWQRDDTIEAYDAQGESLWQRRVTRGDRLDNLHNPIAIDSANDIVHASRVTLDATIEGPTTPHLGAADVLVAKLSGTGDVRWLARIGTEHTDTPIAMATAPNREIVVAYTSVRANSEIHELTVTRLAP